jgi:hypothetical protein
MASPGDDRMIPPVFPLTCAGALVLDFGRKLTGRVRIELKGRAWYAYASDPEPLSRTRVPDNVDVASCPDSVEVQSA